MLQGRAACLALVGDDEDAGVTCPAVIWLDIKIRVTTRTWPCPIEYTVHEEALGQHEKALEIRTRVFGSEHPDVADSKYNLASLSLSLSLSRFLSTLQHVFLSLFFLAPSIGPEKRGTKSGKKSAQV